MSSTASRAPAISAACRSAPAFRAASAPGKTGGSKRRAVGRSAVGGLARERVRGAPPFHADAIVECDLSRLAQRSDVAGAAAPATASPGKASAVKPAGGGSMPERPSRAAAAMPWASGSGAPWRPSTCHTATASSQPSSAPPISSGARASGRPSASTSAQSASGQSPRSAARSTSGPALSASKRSTCSTRIRRRSPFSSASLMAQRSPNWRAMMPRRISRVPPRSE